MSQIMEKLMLTCRRITLNDCRMESSIGAYDFERRQTQTVVFDIDVWIPFEYSTGDDLAKVYDYTAIAAAVQKCVGEGHTDLQEALADKISDIILADGRVAAVRIRTCKPQACAIAGGVSVETFRLGNIAQ